MKRFKYSRSFLINKMAFHDKPRSVRLNDEIQEKLELLEKLYPDRYESQAHLIRCAVIELYNRRIDMDGNRKEKNKDSRSGSA